MHTDRTDGSEEGRKGLSRRQLLVAAAAMSTLAAGSQVALATTPTGPYSYGDPSQGFDDLNEETIYPFYAVWLMLTTIGKFKPPVTSTSRPTDPDLVRWAAAVNLKPECVINIWKALDKYHISDLTGQPWSSIRAAYGDLVGELSNNGSYSGSQCPGSKVSMTHISNISPSFTPR